MKEEEFKFIKALLPEDGKRFPVGKGINVICGKTFAKTNRWWKAVLLIKTKFDKVEKYQIRLYGWWKNNEGVYKVRQKFNISPSRYVVDLIDVLRLIIEESGKEDLLEKIYNKFTEKIDELEKAKRKLEKQKSRIQELKKDLKEFKQLLNSPKTNERKLHSFLKKNPWMFGTNYRRIYKSEKPITVKSRNDFLLQRMDGYIDILELKSHRAPLFVGVRGKKKALSKELKDSISQVMQYLATARTYYLTIKDELGYDIYFPEGIIVIGRRKNENKKLLKIHNEFLNKIRVWTYDDLLDNAKEVIKTYQKGRAK